MSITGWHRSSLLMSKTLLTKPATDPTKSGYIFAGWYADDAYATVFDFDNTMVSADTTIYALWSKELVAKTSVSFAFPTGVDSTETGLSDDENQRLDQIITGYNVNENVSWEESTCTVSGTLAEGKTSDTPIFVSLDLSTITYDGLVVYVGETPTYGWVKGHESASGWQSKLVEKDGKLYIKLAKYLTKKDDLTTSADPTTYTIHVLNGLGGDANKDGYEVARLTFTIKSTVTGTNSGS